MRKFDEDDDDDDDVDADLAMRGHRPAMPSYDDGGGDVVRGRRTMIVINDGRERMRRKDEYEDDDASYSRDDHACDDAIHRACSSCLDGVFDNVTRAAARRCALSSWAKDAHCGAIGTMIAAGGMGKYVDENYVRCRCGHRHCDLVCCGGTYGIEVISAVPCSATDEVADRVDYFDADAAAPGAAGAILAASSRDIGNDDDDDDSTDMDIALRIRSCESNTTTSSSRRGLQGHYNTADVSLADDSSSSCSTSDDVSVTLFPYDDAEDDVNPPPGNVVEIATVASIDRCGDDVTNGGRLGIAPMIDDVDDFTTCRGGDDRSGGNDDRTSNNDDHEISERPYISLTRILRESSGRIHPSSVSITVGGEMPTKEEEPPPLLRTDIVLANEIASPTTTIATVGYNRAMMSRAKLRRRKLRRKEKIADG
jgi:hypothetical protein